LLSDLQSPATPLPFANVSYQLGTYRNPHPASLIPCPTYKKETVSTFETASLIFLFFYLKMAL
ncbi:MAG TPA: hypothetical protein PLM04_07375, partial [Paludibacteraceae bacterium]|nr:hypothetical protein [Paludibacteraceae bacterium]